MVRIPLRWTLAVALSCAGAAGCAMMPIITANLAAQGAQGLVALTLIPIAKMQDKSGKDVCVIAAEKGIAVTESLEMFAPITEGPVGSFEPAWWRLEWAREGYPEIERARTPIAGTLAVTDRSLFFAPEAGATSIRIPYDVIQEVDIARMATTGEPRFVVIKSCLGRYDVIGFRQRQRDLPDPETTTAAAVRIKARLTAFQANADK